MRKAHIIILFILQVNLGLSQGYNGTYKIEYIQSIVTEKSVDNKSGYQDFQNRISIGHGILEFKNQSVKIHNFVAEPIETEIKKDEFQLNGIDIVIDKFNQDSVLLIPKNDNKIILVLKPFKTEKIQLNREDFLNKEWRIESKTSGLASLKLHFSDSSTVILNYQGAEFGYANYGEWRILQSGKYYLLNITDRENMNEFMFYCYSRSKNSIITEFSEEEPFGESLPIRHNITLIKQDELTNEEILKKERELIGEWSLINFENDLSYSFLDSLENETFNIEFKEKASFNISYSFDAVIGGENVSYSNQENGTWKLATNGSYIIIRPQDGWVKYFSIATINKNTLILDLDYYYEKRGTFGARIKMKKK